METFEDLFTKHQDFSLRTFTNSTAKSSLKGCRKECNEAIEELHGINHDYDRNALPLEYADCFLYLVDSIARSGLSLDNIKRAIIMKMEINKGREWKQNTDGTYSHIEK